MSVQADQPPKHDAGITAGPAAPKLQPLSASDFKVYNRMSEHMEYFHNNFRITWNQLYEAASNSKSTYSASRMVTLGLNFCSHLTLHHDIEEAHIFPVLGKRMPSFKANAKTGPLEQHRQIHKGLDKLEHYLRDCKNGDRPLRREEVKEILDSFGAVLWTHLDEEVRELGAENMRTYWSKEEMRRMPM